MSNNYADKYLDARWQQFRLKRLELAGWQCEMCGSQGKLNIHHRFYISGREPWEYIPETTVVLCDECHEVTHDFDKDFHFINGWEQLVAGACEERGYPCRVNTNQELSEK